MYYNYHCPFHHISAQKGAWISLYPRIRALREDCDLNQTKMAAILGMSQTGYSKYETGENDLPTAVLIQLAHYHNTSVDYLLGLTNERLPYPAPNTSVQTHNTK